MQHHLLLFLAAIILASGARIDAALGAQPISVNDHTHWAFAPLERPEVPAFADSELDSNNWPRNPIDHFVLAQLRPRGLAPSSAADRYTLIRRVYLDFIGLPPTVAQVDSFVADAAPGAWERLVDEVLASPRFGERWGRHWLDQARYADTHGYSNDQDRSMWPYRDWVIDAFNRDLPFDQFTIQQLAGDLLAGATTPQLVATGFHRNTLINSEGGTKADQFRDEQIKDRVDTTAGVWMGLTAGCAKCHDHKYDPISAKEYYQLYAFFDSTEDKNSVDPSIRLPSESQSARLSELDVQVAALQSRLDDHPGRAQRRSAWEAALVDQATAPSDAPAADQSDVDAELATLANISADQRTDEQRQQLEQAFLSSDDELSPIYTELNSAKTERTGISNALPTTMVMREVSSPPQTHMQVRGDFLRVGDPVEPDVPAVLPSMQDSPARRSRLDLARWLFRDDHPLTARVRMNRIWMRLFGQGLVETENDWGLQGTLPTHPQLLDWLATEFMRQGWSTKQMLRMIALSATYRQASRRRLDAESIDPTNRWLWRQNRIRVEAEIVRDLGLAASGLLSDKIGGPSVFPPIPEGVYDYTQPDREWKVSSGEDRYRRGMYTFFQRSAPHPMLSTFDTPKFNETCTRRDRSNTPLQSLTMANDEAIVEMTRALADRVLRQSAESHVDRMIHMFRTCMARPPTDAEFSFLENFLRQQAEDFAIRAEEAEKIVQGMASPLPTEENASWVATARVLLNLDEFITRE